MTKYQEELEMLKTTTTKAGLEFQLCGVEVEEEMRLISKDEAEDLRSRIREKLSKVAE